MPLDADKYSRSVSLLCPTCGGTDFQHDTAVVASDAPVTCARCGLEITKDDLINANAENLSINTREVAEAAAKDITKELAETLRKAFSGNTNIRLK